MRIKSLITLLISLSLTAQAQFISGYGFKFGVVSSMQIFEGSGARNLGWVFYPDLNWNRRLGPQIGLFAQVLNTRYLTLQSEISYLQKGIDDEVRPTSLGPDGTFIEGKPFTIEMLQFDYIAFSVLAQPRVPIKQIELYILAGPSLNILIANKEWPFKDADILTPSVVIGGGLEFKKLFEFPLLIEIRYNPDLKYFFENEYIKSKFQVWQFILGAKLNR